MSYNLARTLAIGYHYYETIVTRKTQTMNTTIRYSQLAAFKNKFNAAPSRNAGDIPSFEIYTLECIEDQQSSWDAEVQKLRNFEVIWIKTGKGFLQVDGQNYILTGNMIYCIPPGKIRKATIESGTEGYYISFATEFLFLSGGDSHSSVWFEYFDGQSNVVSSCLDQDQHFELEMIAEKMKWEFSNHLSRRLELLKGLLNIFMIYFSRKLESPRQNTLTDNENELARKFIKLLKKQFHTKKMVIDYARQLCVTPNYLNRIVKKVTGFRASHHIQQQIVLEAKRHALYSSSSMKEIAYHLGFDNLAHFSTFFKKNCGMNFTDYKKGLKVIDQN